MAEKTFESSDEHDNTVASVADNSTSREYGVGCIAMTAENGCCSTSAVVAVGNTVVVAPSWATH